MNSHTDSNNSNEDNKTPVSYSLRRVRGRLVEKKRKKRGRKPKYHPDSKALETYNPLDGSHRMKEIIKLTIENHKRIYTFEEVIEKYGGILRGFFYDVDLNDEKQRLKLSKTYDATKRQFIKDEKRKRDAKGGKYKAVNDKLNNEAIKQHIIENLTPDMIEVDANGLFLFDLSKLTHDAKEMYAFIKNDLKDDVITGKVRDITTYLTFKQLELDYKKMTIERAELILREHEVITDLEGNTLDRMTKQRAKKVIQSTDSILKDIESNDYTYEEKLQMKKKRELLDLYKVGRDISKKRNNS